MARWRSGIFSPFRGSNPITVAPGKYTHVGFSMLPYRKGIDYQPYDTADSGGISGVVTLDGQPLEGAFVTLYVDTAEDLRGSTYATSPPPAREGFFRFDYLPEVEYYVVARKRSAGRRRAADRRRLLRLLSRSIRFRVKVGKVAQNRDARSTARPARSAWRTASSATPAPR